MPSRVDFRNDRIIYLSMALLAISIVGASYVLHQEQFLPIAMWIVVSSFAYYLILQCKEANNSLSLGLLTGIVTRLGIVFAFPLLSDDIYRFYWDGALSIHGISPYGVLPADALGRSVIHNKDLFSLLNSQGYYTIYPPIAQLLYAVGAMTKSLVGCNLVLKLCFIVIEAIGIHYVIKILRHFNLPTWRVLIYYLCPLVIIEGLGNLHFEILMCSFLMIGYYFYCKNKFAKSSVWIALSIATKLLPLMLLPYFWFKLKGREKIVFFGTVSFVILLLFAPMIPAIQSVGKSVDLYFQKFEFNASIYFLLRNIGINIVGYNLIQILGPILALVTMLSNVWLAFKFRNQQNAHLFLYSLAVWSIYLICATTVHPWYVIPLVMFGVFVEASYVSVWSSLIFLSYSFYDPKFHDYQWVLIIIEYTTIALLFRKHIGKTWSLDQKIEEKNSKLSKKN
jgi:alpha-1,6-mannosyltransferase